MYILVAWLGYFVYWWAVSPAKAEADNADFSVMGGVGALFLLPCIIALLLPIESRLDQ